MHTLTPEQLLEIARRVHETLEEPKRWHQGSWGRDDDGYRLSFDGRFHIEDEEGRHHKPALAMRPPDAARSFCLGAAIRIHIGDISGRDPSCLGDLVEQVCLVYVNAGRLHRHLRFENTFEPCLEAVIEWNDQTGRTHEEVRELTGAVLRHLDARRR